MHKSSYSKMEWFKNTYLNLSEKLNILDVGSLDKRGNFNYKKIFNERKWNYTGLDVLPGNNVDIVVEDIYNWSEIEDNTYDVIISGQFFEHLEFFWLTMVQIERVLKPGGYVCIIAPSSGRKHGNLDDFYRFYEDGFRALAKYVDLKILHISTNNEVEPWCDTCLVAYKCKGYDPKTEYLKNSGKVSKKLLIPAAYLYLIAKSKPCEIGTNIKLYKVLKSSECFDIEYYLNKYPDIPKSKWCKYFSPELHYVCNGFNEGRKFNRKYNNKNSKRDFLEDIKTK